MLDELKYIHQKDAQDALGVAAKQYQQLQTVFEIPKIKVHPENIVFAGMGGSGLEALLSATWPGYRLPFEICRSYTIPAYVNQQTLFIASSYSGNTEETLEALAQAQERGAIIAVITAGGQLAKIAQEKNYPMVRSPVGYQPRYTALFGLKAITTILQNAGLANVSETEHYLEKAANFLKAAIENWLPEVPAANNQAKQIATELAGKSAVVYAGPLMFPAAYKWKISINENAKTVAWCNQLPEFNHNEFIGWTSHPVDKPYGVANLLSSFEHSRVQKRFVVTERLLSGQRPAAINIEAQGSNTLEHLLYLSVFGDFVSLYLALLNGLNPTPVELIEKFKTELSK